LFWSCRPKLLWIAHLGESDERQARQGPLSAVLLLVPAVRQGASLALGLVASTLAFWSGLLVALLVGMLAFVGVLAAMRRGRVLAVLEQTAAACMVVAIVFVGLDGGDLHWADGTRASVSFLYWIWAFVAILFLWGSAMTRRRPSG